MAVSYYAGHSVSRSRSPSRSCSLWARTPQGGERTTIPDVRA